MRGFGSPGYMNVRYPHKMEWPFMRGFGSPGYANVRYPHKMEWPFIRDRQSGKADYNPVSSCRRRFTVPEDWSLSVEGIDGDWTAVLYGTEKNRARGVPDPRKPGCPRLRARCPASTCGQAGRLAAHDSRGAIKSRLFRRTGAFSSSVRTAFSRRYFTSIVRPRSTACGMGLAATLSR